MKAWLPIPGTVTGRLVEAAIQLFRDYEYDQVSVQGICKEAGLTTGALYHHFGSKADLFALIQLEMERRIADRMEGAVDASGLSGRAAAVLSVIAGFDAACKLGIGRIVSETIAATESSPMETVLMTACGETIPVRARILTQMLRSAVRSAIADPPSQTQVRDAMIWVLNQS